MRRSRLLVLLLGVLALLATGASVASASPTTAPPRDPQVGFLAPVTWNSGHGTATVVGSYRCSPPAPGSVNHLWVSVKQGGPDPTAEGSSSTVNAWYDTNISQDVAVTCDGRWHARTVTLGMHPTDFIGRPLTRLVDGKAWLQFCLVQGPEDDQDGSQSVVASESRWLHAVGFGHYAR
jgi:hypothetical protein